MKKLREGGLIISFINQIKGRIFTKLLKKYTTKINPAQGKILIMLAQNNDLSIKEIAQKTLLGKSTLTSMLDRLEKAGFVERRHLQKDRRTIIIHITQTGKALIGDYTKAAKELTTIIYKGFQDSDIEFIEKSLHKILNNLTSYESEHSK